VSRPFVTPSICQGGEEQHELHVRYCVPLAEQLRDTRTLTGAQLADVLAEVLSQARENREAHGHGDAQADREAIRGVLEGLFTDLEDEPPWRKCPKCDGCGRIGTDDEGTPWTFWENLPVKSAAAVMLGLVRPVTCPKCNGSGAVSR
jgi:hypothetical protein